jgi:hypothetical protein
MDAAGIVVRAGDSIVDRERCASNAIGVVVCGRLSGARDA